jgi:anti-sigma28 factor (negative regulator of flagellin synthesis)
MGTSAPGRVFLKGFLPFLALTILFSGESLAQVDGTLQFNEQFLGMISSIGDADVVQFQEAAGSRITITVTAQSGNQLKPSLELLDDQMAVIDVGSKLTESGKVAEIKKYLLAHSGIYYARVGSRNGLTGTYSVKIKGSVKKEFKSTANLGLAGEVDDIVFDAREDAKLSGTVKRTSGDLIPAVVELAGPNGVLVAIAGKTNLNKGETKLKLKNITLPFLGTYRLRITGQGGTTGDSAARCTRTSIRAGRRAVPGSRSRRYCSAAV